MCNIYRLVIKVVFQSQSYQRLSYSTTWNNPVYKSLGVQY